MAFSMIEKLLEQANSSTSGDTSMNVSKRIFLEVPESIAFFNETKSNMTDIDEWNKNSSATEYELFDENGAVVSGRAIGIGSFIRIGLYGGGKYDWVNVIAITEDELEFVITVQPSHDPTKTPQDHSSISHFFGAEARNNFCVQLNDKTVAFYIIGLHEKQNTEFTDGLIESARNTAIANVGYYTGLQKAVWKQFASNFMKKDEAKDDN